jgi:hypothetical protein
LLLELRTAVSFCISNWACRVSVFPGEFLRIERRFALHFA